MYDFPFKPHTASADKPYSVSHAGLFPDRILTYGAFFVKKKRRNSPQNLHFSSAGVHMCGFHFFKFTKTLDKMYTFMYNKDNYGEKSPNTKQRKEKL
jgi:hypothetical protein